MDPRGGHRESCGALSHESTLAPSVCVVRLHHICACKKYRFDK